MPNIYVCRQHRLDAFFCFDAAISTHSTMVLASAITRASIELRAKTFMEFATFFFRM